MQKIRISTYNPQTPWETIENVTLIKIRNGADPDIYLNCGPDTNTMDIVTTPNDTWKTDPFGASDTHVTLTITKEAKKQ